MREKDAALADGRKLRHMGAPLGTIYANSSSSTKYLGVDFNYGWCRRGSEEDEICQRVGPDESEFQILDEATKAGLVQKYMETTGGLPGEEEEPSREQLSALYRKIYALSAPPYADFSVFTPYGRKTMRASRFRNYIPTGDGFYAVKELPGPASYAQWLACYRVWRVAMIMLGTISLANLQAYELFMEKLNKLYPTAWHLLVQADDKGRSEHLSRLQLQAMIEHQKGGKVPQGWLPSKPSWDPIFRLLIEDGSYWAENVHNPALVWMAHGSRGMPKTPEERVATVEMVGGSAALHPQVEKVQEVLGGGPKRLANKEKREAKRRRIVAEREELARLRGDQRDGGKAGEGKGKSKEGGVQLCFAWNNNNAPCKDIPPGGECQNKVKRAHKCTKCGSPGHQSLNCSQG